MTEEEGNLGSGGCEGAEVDTGRFWARDLVAGGRLAGAEATGADADVAG